LRGIALEFEEFALPASPTPDQLAVRMSGVQPSAIRRMLAVSSRPGMISFAGGLPVADLFDVEGLWAASEEVMRAHAKSALQ